MAKFKVYDLSNKEVSNGDISLRQVESVPVLYVRDELGLVLRASLTPSQWNPELYEISSVWERHEGGLYSNALRHGFERAHQYMASLGLECYVIDKNTLEVVPFEGAM